MWASLTGTDSPLTQKILSQPTSEVIKTLSLAATHPPPTLAAAPPPLLLLA